MEHFTWYERTERAQMALLTEENMIAVGRAMGTGWYVLIENNSASLVSPSQRQFSVGEYITILGERAAFSGSNSTDWEPIDEPS